MRQDTSGQFQGLTKYEKMAVAMSQAAQKDLTYHFQFYNLPIGEKAKSLVSHLEKGDKKTYYVNEKCGAKDATAFENPDSKPKVAASGSGVVNLQIAMDEKDAAILCYEVYRDRKFLGITYDGIYQDTKAEPNQDHTYTVVAYDRKQNPSKTSEPVVKNPSEPIILFAQNTVASLYQDFDPMTGVIGKNAAGEDLTESVKVVENTVDTSQKGNYYVTYEVQDAITDFENLCYTEKKKQEFNKIFISK